MLSKSKNKLLEQLDQLPEKQLLSTFFEVLGKNDIELATDMLRGLSMAKRNWVMVSMDSYNLKSYAEAEYLLWQAIELVTQHMFFYIRNVKGLDTGNNETEENTIRELKGMQKRWLAAINQVKAPVSPSFEHSHAQTVIDASKKVFEAMEMDIKYAKSPTPVGEEVKE